MEPTYPIINATLMSIMENEYHIPADRSFRAAKRLVAACRAMGLDIVKRSWIDGDPGVPTKADPLSEAIARVQEAEASGWTPWIP